MSNVAIRVENLSKKFILGERLGFKTFRETLQDALIGPLRRIIRGWDGEPLQEEKIDTNRQLWALKDVSFEVQHGEVLGIIGPNGAGKSTLLKILSRITEPTGGYAEIHGRVGSLLEVGTGFHPELTGRENVYLNGSILGMSKAEIRRKFDDIVSFAGVEKFIDTPVKRYSSGMQVRLAFAVAAHLDPEILIIDEVLAVGDAEFQKRCLGKMDEVSRSGRTILFVSHNMAAVEGLCPISCLLSSGSVAYFGKTADAISHYMYHQQPPVASVDFTKDTCRGRTYVPVLRFLRIVDPDGEPTTSVPLGGDITFVVGLESAKPLVNTELRIDWRSAFGQRLLSLHSRIQYPKPIRVVGQTVIRVTLHDCILLPGRYGIDIHVSSGASRLASAFGVTNVTVLLGNPYGTGLLPPPRLGPIVPKVTWATDHGGAWS